MHEQQLVCGPIDRQALMKIVNAEGVVAVESEQRWTASEIRITEIPDERCRSRKNHERENDAEASVKKQVSWEMRAQLKASSQLEYERRNHPPQVEVGQVSRERSLPRNMAAVLKKIGRASSRERV